jgi:hypothetical protein
MLGLGRAFGSPLACFWPNLGDDLELLVIDCIVWDRGPAKRML